MAGSKRKINNIVVEAARMAKAELTKILVSIPRDQFPIIMVPTGLKCPAAEPIPAIIINAIERNYEPGSHKWEYILTPEGIFEAWRGDYGHLFPRRDWDEVEDPAVWLTYASKAEKVLELFKS